MIPSIPDVPKFGKLTRTFLLSAPTGAFFRSGVIPGMAKEIPESREDRLRLWEDVKAHRLNGRDFFLVPKEKVTPALRAESEAMQKLEEQHGVNTPELFIR